MKAKHKWYTKIYVGVSNKRQRGKYKLYRKI